MLAGWTGIDQCLCPTYAAAESELAWPPLRMATALLVTTWHGLSNLKLTEALQHRARFRPFRGFTASEPTPGRTTFARFRSGRVNRKADRTLFEGAPTIGQYSGAHGHVAGCKTDPPGSDGSTAYNRAASCRFALLTLSGPIGVAS